MMYKCIECDCVFEESEIAVWHESRGEFWGSPCYERVTGCPNCHGSYKEAVECENCGEWHDEYELEDGLCEKCREETEDKE